MPHPERSVIFERICGYKTVIDPHKNNGMSVIIVTNEDAQRYLPLARGVLGGLGGGQATIKKFDQADPMHTRLARENKEPIVAIISVLSDHQKEALLKRMRNANLRNQGTIFLS